MKQCKQCGDDNEAIEPMATKQWIDATALGDEYSSMELIEAELKSVTFKPNGVYIDIGGESGLTVFAPSFSPIGALIEIDGVPWSVKSITITGDVDNAWIVDMTYYPGLNPPTKLVKQPKPTLPQVESEPVQPECHPCECSRCWRRNAAGHVIDLLCLFAAGLLCASLFLK